MRNLKKTLFLVLAVALIFTSVGVTSFAVLTDPNHKEELTDNIDFKKRMMRRIKRRKLLKL